MPESGEHLIERDPLARVRDRPGKHKRQITQISRRFLKLMEPTNTHHGRHWLMPTGDHQIGPLLRISHQAGNASLGRLCDGQLSRVVQNSHASTVHVSV
ncbi:hypothetical protein Nocox_02200 [Nonomuraea coxensis DSM 45129]|uniref:Transposase n=1 Tax=Nonomuraea coxensis DSM 45129 TaxID=1122611 RepID=A0ABX8TRS3_9ACTN|nr:hypothetical protein Nocox_02200 [Nonomuraea coxensis DSM 45129]